MIIRKLRLQRGWSQEQLATMSGLSIRTIQRLERGQKAGLESLKSLAAVFEVDLADLQDLSELEQETNMNTDTNITNEEKLAMSYVREVKGFYSHLIQYVIVITLLFVINLVTNPAYIWAKWPALGWGIGIIFHALSAFEVMSFFGPEWEKKQIEKRLGRKL